MGDFSNLKINDKVLLTGWYHNDYIGTVTRVGKTFVEVDNRQKYSFNGYMKPYSSRHTRILKLATQEDFDLINHIKNQLNVKYFFSDKFLKYYSRLSKEQIKEFESLMLKCKEWIDKGDY